MALFGFGKKKDEEKNIPACACQSDCATFEATEEDANKVKIEDGAMSVKVLGVGCASCHEQYEQAKAAVKSMGLDVEVEYRHSPSVQSVAGNGQGCARTAQGCNSREVEKRIDRLIKAPLLMFLIVSTIERGNVLMNEEKMNAPCAIGTKGAVTTGSEQRVPIHLKLTLTIKKAAEYSNIGINKIDTMLKQPNCPFVLYVGTRKLVKRREFEEYIRRELTI